MAGHRHTNIKWSWNPSSDPAPTATPAAGTAMQTYPPIALPFHPRPADTPVGMALTPANNLPNTIFGPTTTAPANNLPSTPPPPPTPDTPPPVPTPSPSHRYPLRSRGPPSPIQRPPRNNGASNREKSITNRRARRAKFNAQMNDFVAKVIEERRMEKVMRGMGGLGVDASGGEASTDAATLRMRDADDERAWAETAKLTFRVQWGGLRKRPVGQWRRQEQRQGQRQGGESRQVQGQDREFGQGQSRNARRRRRRRMAEGGAGGLPTGNNGNGAMPENGNAGTPQLHREEATVGSSSADADAGMEIDMGVEEKKEAGVEGGDDGDDTLHVGMMAYGGIIVSTDGYNFEVAMLSDGHNGVIMDTD